jgi:hypothetical protein
MLVLDGATAAVMRRIKSSVCPHVFDQHAGFVFGGECRLSWSGDRPSSAASGAMLPLSNTMRCAAVHSVASTAYLECTLDKPTTAVQN